MTITLTTEEAIAVAGYALRFDEDARAPGPSCPVCKKKTDIILFENSFEFGDDLWIASEGDEAVCLRSGCCLVVEFVRDKNGVVEEDGSPQAYLAAGHLQPTMIIKGDDQ